MALPAKKAAISLPALTIGLTASMGGFLFGSDTGSISGYIVMSDFLKRFAQKQSDGSYAFSNVREGLIVGMLSIGCLVGCLIAGPMGDKIGRRKAIMAFCCVYYIGNTIAITTMHAWYQLVIGRTINGLAIGGCSSLVPVYVAETVPRAIRGTMTAAYQLFVTMGILVSYCVNLGTSNLHTSAQWRAPIAIMYGWNSILLFGMFFLPESPRWLLSKDRQAECLRALEFIAGKNGDKVAIEEEYQEIETKVREDAQIGKVSPLSAFNPNGKALYRTLLGFLLQMGQQLTGANYFFYYGTVIFKSVGISNSFVTQIILGAVNFVCTFPGLWFTERFGRRKPLLFGALWQMAWLLVFGAVGSEEDTSKQSIGSVMIVASCFFIASFASTWGPGVWVAIGEMYPLRIRSTAAAFATTGNWSWNFLLTFFTPFITNSIGYKYGYVFAGCNAGCFILVYLFYYESSGLSLEQVDLMYNDPNVKPWNSSNWSPPGIEHRGDAQHVSKEEQALRAGVYAESQHHEHTGKEEA